MQKQKAVDGTVNDFGSNHMITLWDGICKAWKGLILSEVERQKVPKCWKGKLPMKINGCPAIKKPNLIWHSFSNADCISLKKCEMVDRFKSYPCSMEFSDSFWVLEFSQI